MSRDAPEVVVKNILRDNWLAPNTESITPSIHHGWLDPGSNELEVTVSDPDESVLGGGDTGYSGINQDGVPIQNYTGIVRVNCWADRTRSNQNPRKMAWLMRAEVGRIISENYDPDGYDLYPLADIGARRFVEESEEPGEPTVWRYQVEVQYGWRRDAFGSGDE